MSVALVSRFSMHVAGRGDLERVLRDWEDTVAGNDAVAGVSARADIESEEPSPEPGCLFYRGKIVLSVVPARGTHDWNPIPLASAALGIAGARQRRRSPGLQVQLSEIEIA